MQRRMIRKPQIVTKPDDDRPIGCSSGHIVTCVARCPLQLKGASRVIQVTHVFNKPLEDDLKRYAILYLATLIVIVPIDFLFLGLVAKSFFTSQVGDMLGNVRLAPAILFYLLYVVGIVIFVNGTPGVTTQSTLIYGGLFGLFCYATFELTSLSLLKHWTWPVVVVDVSWGTFVTAVASTLGLWLANWISAKV
jgi:uncharacterized membrane protein